MIEALYKTVLEYFGTPRSDLFPLVQIDKTGLQYKIRIYELRQYIIIEIL